MAVSSAIGPTLRQEAARFMMAFLALCLGGFSLWWICGGQWWDSTSYQVLSTCILGVVIILISGLCAADDEGERGFNRRLWEGVAAKSRGLLGPLSAWIIALCLVPITGAVILHVTPLRLESAQIVVLEDGRVVFPGTILETGRYVSGVSLSQSHTGQIPSVVVGAKGQNLHVTITARLVLKEGPALENLIRGQASSLAEDYYRVQFTFFSSKIKPRLDELVEGLIREIEAGSLSGSDASMLVRLGTLLKQEWPLLPPWLAEIEISKVTVTGLRLGGR